MKSKTYAKRTGSGWFMRQARKSQEETKEPTEMNESTLAIQPRKTSQEVAASASAALAKATIEAKFVIALQRPRSVMNARASILEACKRPRFAEAAMYHKPQGQKLVNGRWEPNILEGLSIRFAETALQAWKNIDVAATTAWEDDDKRLVRITVTDLESNTSYADEVLLSKTVERSKVKDGQEVIGDRLNTDGKKVFLIRASEDELANKVNSAKSKVIRNSGLRLIPQDILEEAAEAIKATNANGGDDPKADAKRIADGFSKLGIQPTDIEGFLGHSLSSITPKELSKLRGMFAAIRDGEASWADYSAKEASATTVDVTDKTEPAKSEPKPDATPPMQPWEKLGITLQDAGFTWEHFKAWAVKSKQVEGVADLQSFADLAKPDAERFLRAIKGLLTQLAAEKGGAK